MRLHLILGFLGAGKTTLIRSMFREGRFRNEKILLVVNDFGKENYDAARLQGSGAEIVEITEGCLCCGNMGTLMRIIEDSAARSDIDRMIIEPSGIFLPDVFMASLKHANLTNIQLEPVPVIVDLRFLSAMNRAWPPFITKHVEFCDYVILNKAAALSRELLSDMMIRLSAINNKAGFLGFEEAVGKVAGGLPLRRRDAGVNVRFHRLSDPVHPFKMEQRSGEELVFPDTKTLEAYLESEPDTLVRAKGVVRVADAYMNVDYVRNRLSTELDGKEARTGLSLIYEEPG